MLATAEVETEAAADAVSDEIEALQSHFSHDMSTTCSVAAADGVRVERVGGRAVRRDGVSVGSGQHLTCAPTCFDPLSAKAASLKRTRCIRRDDDHKAIFDYVDADADGYISLTEFRQFLRPKSRRRSSPRPAARRTL